MTSKLSVLTDCRRYIECRGGQLSGNDISFVLLCFGEQVIGKVISQAADNKGACHIKGFPLRPAVAVCGHSADKASDLFFVLVV